MSETTPDPAELPEEVQAEVADLAEALSEEPPAPESDFAPVVPGATDSSGAMGSAEGQAARSESEVAGESNSALGVPVQEPWRCPNCAEFRLNNPSPELIAVHEAIH